MVPAAGGEENQVLDSTLGSEFTVAQRGIYFMGPRGLHYFDFSTRAIRQIRAMQKPTDWVLSVSPDEHWLLYPQFDQSGSDLMLVENFR